MQEEKDAKATTKQTFRFNKRTLAIIAGLLAVGALLSVTGWLGYQNYLLHDQLTAKSAQIDQLNIQIGQLSQAEAGVGAPQAGILPYKESYDDSSTGTYVRSLAYGDGQYYQNKLKVTSIAFDASGKYAGGDADSETYHNYVVLRATITNEGTQTYVYAPRDFAIETTDSDVIEPGYVISRGSRLDEKDNWGLKSSIASGKSKDIQILFPLEDKSLADTLVWTPLANDFNLNIRNPFKNAPVRILLSL